MPILNIYTDTPGQAGIDPRIIFIATNDPRSTVLQAGYLSKEILTQGFIFFTTDIVCISTQESGVQHPSLEFMGISFSNGIPSLQTTRNDIVGNVTANHIATFAPNRGGLSQDPATALNALSIQALGGNIIAGQNGTAGNFQSYGPTLNKGNLTVKSTNNSGNFTVTITNNSHGQSTTYTFTDPGVFNASLLNTNVANADVQTNLITFDTTINASDIASGASKVLAGGLAGQYRIRDLFINRSFSLIGGNRNLSITDSSKTNVYSVIPSATLLSGVNQRWGGSSALPFPAGNLGMNTPLTINNNLIATATGGTTDYVSGTFVICGILERIS